MDRWQLLLFGSLCLVVFAGVLVSPGAAQSYDSVEGYLIPTDDVQADRLDPQEFDLPPDTPDSVSILKTARGKTYVVYSESSPLAGEATVTGRVFEGDDWGVIIADKVDIRQPARNTAFGTLTDDPPVGKHIRVNATIERVPILADPAGNTITAQLAGGALQGPNGTTIAILPGREARTVIQQYRNRSAARNLQTRYPRLPSGERFPTIDTRETEYAVFGRAHVEGVVDELGPEYLYPTAFDFPTRRVATRAELADAEYVHVTGEYVGARISTQETLEAAAGCGPSLIMVGNSCVPVSTDIVVHVGALALPSGEIVPVVALSNYEQTEAVTAQVGTYAIEGRQLPAKWIDPRWDGPGVVAFDMAAEGGLKIDSQTRARLAKERNRLRSQMREQLAANDSEWANIQDTAEATPTPTATPAATQTPTSSATPTVTPTPTPTATPQLDASPTPGAGQTESAGPVWGQTPVRWFAVGLLLLGATAVATFSTIGYQVLTGRSTSQSTLALFLTTTIVVGLVAHTFIQLFVPPDDISLIWRYGVLTISLGLGVFLVDRLYHSLAETG